MQKHLTINGAALTRVTFLALPGTHPLSHSLLILLKEIQGHLITERVVLKVDYERTLLLKVLHKIVH